MKTKLSEACRVALSAIARDCSETTLSGLQGMIGGLQEAQKQAELLPDDADPARVAERVTHTIAVLREVYGTLHGRRYNLSSRRCLDEIAAVVKALDTALAESRESG